MNDTPETLGLSGFPFPPAGLRYAHTDDLAPFTTGTQFLVWNAETDRLEQWTVGEWEPNAGNRRGAWLVTSNRYGNGEGEWLVPSAVYPFALDNDSLYVVVPDGSQDLTALLQGSLA